MDTKRTHTSLKPK